MALPKQSQGWIEGLIQKLLAAGPAVMFKPLKDYAGRDLPETPMDKLKAKLSPMTNNRAHVKESICRIMALLGEEPPTHRPWL